MIRSKFTIAVGLLVVAMIAGMTHGTAFANTVSVLVGDNSYDVEYAVTGATIVSVDVDTGFTSLIFNMNVLDNDDVLEITFPRNFFDSEQDGADVPFRVIADGTEVKFEETKTTMLNRTLAIDLTTGTGQVEIIGTVFERELSPIESSCAAGLVLVNGTCTVVEATGVDTPDVDTPDTDTVDVDTLNTDTDDVDIPDMDTGTDTTGIDTSDEDTSDEDVEELLDPVQTTCDEGLVLVNGTCMIADAMDIDTVDEDISTDTSKSTGSTKEFLYGGVAAFGAALGVMIILGLIAKASKSKR